tara:strand:- start:121 stop:342 length:222 start_codon:yes stop_codon:yes gene_type:complete
MLYRKDKKMSIYQLLFDYEHQLTKPFISWTKLENTWRSPIAYPVDGVGIGYTIYDWDEDLYQSDNTKGWVEIE